MVEREAGYFCTRADRTRARDIDNGFFPDQLLLPNGYSMRDYDGGAGPTSLTPQVPRAPPGRNLRVRPQGRRGRTAQAEGRVVAQCHPILRECD